MTVSRAFPWGAALGLAAGIAVLTGLGLWQTQRLHWKAGLIARAAATEAMAPVDLAMLDALADPEFRRVTLDCDLRNGPFVELRALHEGQPGLRLIAPCDGWLVDLGFVPQAIEARPYDRPGTGDAPPVTARVRRVPGASGFAPPPEGRVFYARDTAAMMQVLGVSGAVRDHVLYAEQNVWSSWPDLVVGPPPAAFSNNHLGYALTWFGLAATLAVFGLVLLMRRRRP